jgi:hypothetical protein
MMTPHHERLMAEHDGAAFMLKVAEQARSLRKDPVTAMKQALQTNWMRLELGLTLNKGGNML